MGALPLAAAYNLAATCALPTSTTATTVTITSVQDEPQSIRLATCLDRSVAASGAIASTVSPCLPWRKLLSRGDRLPVLEAPVAGGAACRRPSAYLLPAERLAQVKRPVGRLFGRREPSDGLEPFRRPLGGSGQAAIRWPGGCEAGSCQILAQAKRAGGRGRRRAGPGGGGEQAVGPRSRLKAFSPDQRASSESKTHVKNVPVAL